LWWTWFIALPFGFGTAFALEMRIRVKNFKDLSEREILALAISLEEEDIRTYSDLAAAPLLLCKPACKASWSLSQACSLAARDRNSRFCPFRPRPKMIGLT
jgi:hypothetical protein